MSAKKTEYPKVVHKFTVEDEQLRVVQTGTDSYVLEHALGIDAMGEMCWYTFYTDQVAEITEKVMHMFMRTIARLLAKK